jgi:hypothetical protein
VFTICEDYCLNKQKEHKKDRGVPPEQKTFRKKHKDDYKGGRNKNTLAESMSYMTKNNVVIPKYCTPDSKSKNRKGSYYCQKKAKIK